MKTSTRPTARSQVLLGLAGLWLLATFGWLALLGVEAATSDSLTACPLSQEASIYGEAHWSWLPPGRVCQWQVQVGGTNVTVEKGPPTARIGIGIVLVLWGGALALVRRSQNVPTRNE